MLDTEQIEQLSRIRELRNARGGDQVRSLIDALGDPELQLIVGLEGSPDEARAAMDAAPDEVLDELAKSLRLRSESFRLIDVPGLDRTSLGDFVSLELDVRGWPDTKAFDYVRDAAALRVLARRPDHPRVRELVPEITRLFINGSSERRTNVSQMRPTELDLSGLGALTALRVLVVHQVVDPNGGSLRALEELERVILSWCRGGWLQLDAPVLASLIADGMPAGPEIRGLEEAKGLREIIIRRSGATGLVEALPHLHALEVLDVGWSIELTSADPIRNSKSLRVLKLGKLEKVEALRDHPSLEEALLPCVHDIAPLAGLPKLRRLELAGGSFSTLEPFRDGGMPALEYLDVAQTSLENLDGIEACPRLKTLIAGRTDVLVNADALKDHPSLEEIVLEGAMALKSLKKLGKPPRLKRLALKGSKVTASRIPDEVLELVDPPTLVQKRRATLLAEKQGMKKPKRGQLSKLKKLLLTRDWEKMDLGIQLADSLDDPKIFDALTTGATWGSAGFPSKQVLVQNMVFKGPKVAPWRKYALLNLIAVAPQGTEAAKLRADLTSLMIRGEHSDRMRARLTHLHAFPNLSLLHVSRCKIIDAAAIEKITTLTQLDTSQCEFDGPVLLPPSARKVVIGCVSFGSRPAVDVFGDMGTFSNVETLWVSHAKLDDVTGIANLRSVKSVSFTDVELAPGAEEALRALPSKPEIRLTDR